ncbi:GTP-binding protein [Caballeronia concitans]|uniref:CobW/P47K family protein n=1 Tax=Caballeronia concitans TaxID=1777133 RepID=A0A658QQF2_9BURK|nr:GTP-binding protein [Caballeronia concitans]KIG02718.1 cobalamin synthesis CobW domain protein [Burkholderia sp. MR1]SAL10084.1 CobW/P47K family protein [Caballeronia concitans]
MNQTPLPVTVLSGFVGAGKTTLLDALLANGQNVRVGAIAGRSLHDMEQAIIELAEQQRFDAIVIESTGIANPMDIAEHLAFGDDDQAALAGRAHLDTFVTVVDATSFMRDYASADSLAERGIASGDDDGEEGKTVVETLVEQIEFCDVIVLNKTDLVGEEEVEKLSRVLRGLNPRAVQIRAQYGRAPFDEVIDTGRFDLDTTASAPGWLAILNGEHESDASETSDAAGVGHFVYRARRPFHPERLWNLLHQEWPDVLRAKGFFWLATRSVVGGSLSQAGGTLRHGPAGVWWAAQDRSEWPTDDPELEAEIVAEWFGDPDDNSIGDRRQELVLIGLDLDADAWRRKFDACLLTDDEWAAGAQSWQRLSDPFPAWDVEEHDHEHGDHDHAHEHDHDHGPDCRCDDRGH